MTEQKKKFESAFKLHQNGDLKEAEILLKKNLASFPKHLPSIFLLGTLSAQIHKFQTAKKLLKQTIKIKPEFKEGHNNLGNVFQELGEYQKALSCYQQAIKLNPEYAEAHYNLGCVLERFGKMNEALLSYTTATQYKLNYTKALHNLGRVQLATDDYKNGWIGHELRKGGTQKTYKSLEVLDKKIWNGKKIEGPLIVHGEQGIGDEILYSSMFPDLENYHDDLTITTDERLIPIMQRSFAKINFISRDNKISSNKNKSSTHILAGSLGRIFRNSLNDFKKNKHKWLIPCSKKCDEFKKRLSNLKKNKVGISWRSSGVRSSERNISLIKLASIFPKKNFDIINLEYGDISFEKNMLKKNKKRQLIYFNDLDYKNDLEDLSSLIKSCDLVVSIANATAHLSGAIGIQTWVLVPADSQWYWHSKNKESLWYPNAKLFRQKTRDDWDYVLDIMKKKIILQY